MPNLFRTGDGTSEGTIIVALELIGEDWFKRALIGALELMCDENNWTERGSASVDFARDKANEMVENLEIDVIIPPALTIGVVMLWLTDDIPDGWLICNGQAVSRATYAELFAVWSTDFGAGDGTTTFNLPDYRARLPIGAGLLPSGLANIGAGGTFGDERVTLSVNEIPAHNHSLARSTTTGGSILGSNMGVSTAGVPSITGNTGSGQSHNNIPPVIGSHMVVWTGVL